MYNIFYGSRTEFGHTIWEEPKMVRHIDDAIKYVTDKVIEITKHAVDNGYTIDYIYEDRYRLSRIIAEVPTEEYKMFPKIEHFIGVENFEGVTI